MKAERRKVLEMLANGCITPQEAQLLLDTLYELQVNAECQKSEWDFLLDWGGLKTMAQEYGRISIPVPPKTPPTTSPGGQYKIV
jgi:hypothetical protein